MKKNIAIIFARGGSKGLPKKNIKCINHKPLIAYSIMAAKAVKAIDEIYVSSDDDEILSIAKLYGACLIKRPDHLASDTSPEWLSWQHAIEQIKLIDGKFDILISIPTTSPLREPEDIENCILRLQESKADVCSTVTKANRNPHFNMVKKNKDGFCELFSSPESQISRRQDAPVAYDITTVAYAANVDFVMKSKGLFDGQVTSICIPKERSIDIDDAFDFKIAKLLLESGER